MGVLEEIAENRRRKQKVKEQGDHLDEELVELVRKAFSEGCTGPEIAKVARTSAPRIYQIRDGRR